MLMKLQREGEKRRIVIQRETDGVVVYESDWCLYNEIPIVHETPWGTLIHLGEYFSPDGLKDEHRDSICKLVPLPTIEEEK